MKGPKRQKRHEKAYTEKATIKTITNLVSQEEVIMDRDYLHCQESKFRVTVGVCLTRCPTGKYCRDIVKYMYLRQRAYQRKAGHWVLF